MKKVPFLLSLILVVFNLTAQNSLYVDPVGDLSKNADLDKIVPQYITDFFSPNNYFQESYNSFIKNHVNFGEFTFQYSFFNSPGYGVGDLSDFKNSDSEDFDFEKNFEKLKNLFFRDKNFYEPLYKAVMPIYQQAFSKMTNKETQDILNALQSVITYTEKFELAKESQDEKELDYNFAYTKTKACAFVYRRIKNNELTQNECLSWLNRIYNDLKSSMKPKKGFEDYILTSKLFGEVYSAVSDYSVYSEDKYFAKENGNYVPLNSSSVFSELGCYQQKLSGTRYKVTFFYDEDDINKTFEVINSKETQNIFNLYNYILFVYTDSTSEILNKDQPNQREIFNSKIKDVPTWIANVVALNYTDGKSELLHFIEEGTAFEALSLEYNLKLLNYYFNCDFYLAETDKGEKVICKIIDNNLTVNNLPDEYDYTDFSVWRDYILFIDTKSQKVGILSKNYEVLFQPEIGGFVIPSEDSEFILLSADQNGFFYSLYDIYLNKIGDNTFVTVYSTQYPNSETDFDYPLLDSKDKTMILISYKADEGKGLYVLTDKSGKYLIPEKWPYIIRINLPFENNNVYAVCNKYEMRGETGTITGKWALFNHKGKQLTKFIYSNIDPNADENGLIRCTKGRSKEVYLNKDGKEVKK